MLLYPIFTSSTSGANGSELGLNNSTQASATILRLSAFHDTDMESALHWIINVSNAPEKGFFHIFKKSDPNVWSVFRSTGPAVPTGSPTRFDCPVQHVKSSGTNPFADDDELVLLIVRMGDKYPAETTVPGGRLTFASGNPNPAFSVFAATTLYYTPYKHNKIALYNGSVWELHTFPELSVAVPNTSNTNYDVFLYRSGGSFAFELVAWASNSARSVALVRQDGILVKDGNANERRYLGSFRTSATSGEAVDALEKRLLFNQDNKENRRCRLFGTSLGIGSYSLDSSTPRRWNADDTKYGEILLGTDSAFVDLSIMANHEVAPGDTSEVGIGVNSTTFIGTSLSPSRVSNHGDANAKLHLHGRWVFTQQFGYFQVNLMERGKATVLDDLNKGLEGYVYL